MSGIGTIFNFDRAPVDAEQLQGLCESLSARGPDGTASFCSANIGMCFSALNTTRESRSEEHTSELQSQSNLVCRLLLEKKKVREGGRLLPDGARHLRDAAARVRLRARLLR